MAERAGTVGVPGYEDSTAGNYPPFKPSEEAGAGATPTLEDLQALDSRGVAKGTFQNQLAPTAKDVGWAKFFLWEGGTEWDAFFTAASAQVGQVILSLPHSLSQTGMVAGIIIEIVFATLAMWTVYLMVLLYLDHKNRKIKLGDWYDKEGKDRKVATQYHEVMGNITYKWLGRFSRLVIIIALGGDALAQIIASSSNFHTFIPSVNKRDWGLIWGGVCMLMSFIPSFRNFRLFSFMALVATSFTAWFMLVQGVQNGLKSEVWTNQNPGSVYSFFSGASNMVFTFGGHGMLMEVMDAMYRPYNFHKTFFGSYSYVFTLVIPNTLFVYWGFPAEARQYGNCFAYFEPSVARDIAIILMVIHQVVAYGLFIFPLYYMWEKATGTHNKPMWIKVIVRFPVGAIIWFIAVAFPFFGVINEILGAFTVTFETYIIPCLAFNIHYGYKRFSASHQIDSPKQLSPFLEKIGGYHTIFWINWVIIAFTAVFGLGMGGYASIRGFVESIGSFGVFAACYNC